MSCVGRTRTTEFAARALMNPGGLCDLPSIPRMYYGSAAGDPLPSCPGWDISRQPKGPPLLPLFFQVLRETSSDSDLLFFEDDVTPCLNAVLAMAAFEVPAQYGMVTFFDYFNRYPNAGLFPYPGSWDLYGSQAFKIPARMIPVLKLAMSDLSDAQGWDVWLGRKVREAGLDVAIHSPSLVQHIGVNSSVYAPGSTGRPEALNFPGELFDASNEKIQGPVKTGTWTKLVESDYCSFHGVCGATHRACPKIQR